MATINALDLGLSGATGTGNFVGSTSPSLVTPALGTPSSGTLSSCTGYPTANLTGLGANVATFLATPSSANLAAALTDETGSGAAVFANTPTLVTPVLGAASATSLSFSSTSGIIGTTTNNNAAALSVGELVSSNLLVASQVSLTNNTAANVTTISLTPGDWDVWGSVWLNPNAATLTTTIFVGISTTSATIATTPADGTASVQFFPRSSAVAGDNWLIPIYPCRLSLSAGTTTVYLIASIGFSVNVLGAYGGLYARRRR